MDSSAAVNCSACSDAAGDTRRFIAAATVASSSFGCATPGSVDRNVKKQLATVATKSHAFVRHSSGGAASSGPARGACSSAEGIAEGGGEPLESGGELGIDDPHVGVQPERASRKPLVDLHL